tara:strand:+ start:2193 stop:2627 length:435 start_codon:yes stop_codon:yes gene_type:complete
MTWSFSDSIATDKDKVRLKIGDTDTDDQLLSNETIDALLVIRADVTLCAIDCVRAILAKLARDIDRSAVGMSGQRSQKITHYEGVLRNLVKESGGEVRMKVGGISQDAADTLRDDSDFIKPSFSVGMDDFNGTGGGSDNGWGCG